MQVTKINSEVDKCYFYACFSILEMIFMLYVDVCINL